MSIYFFMKFAVLKANSLVHSVKVSNQGAVYFFYFLFIFLNVLYHSALETKVIVGFQI